MTDIRVKTDNSQKVYLNKTVYEESLDRIRYVFDEFPNVVVCFSGGKDSTVCLELSLIVAKEKGRLPLKVAFIDQEAEWQCTVNYMRDVMSRPEIEPMWFQMPIKISNNCSHTELWHHCWQDNEPEKWLREKEDISIKENKYNTDRFTDLFTKIFAVEYPDTKSAYIGGVRSEESPTRKMAMTSHVTYQYVTWGKATDKSKEHYTFYPIYDWSVHDVWKAIGSNEWKYNKLYDYLYQNGRGLYQMRVSNVHHETAIEDMLFMQEIEKDTWNKITEKIDGANTVKQLFKFVPKELPYMFDTWSEYRDYLLEHLCTDEVKPIFAKKFDYFDRAFYKTPVYERAMKKCVSALLRNDYCLTTLNNFQKTPGIFKYNRLRTENGFDKAN